MKKQPSLQLNFSVLDGLRGIAALYVLINHCRGNLFIGGKAMLEQLPFEQWSWLQKAGFAALRFTSLSREFVILFFVLSGFSIAHSLSRSPAFFSYLKRRFLRIYPVFLGALLWALLVYQWIQPIPGVLPEGSFSVAATPELAVKNLLFIPGGALTAQFWSLTQEVLFYLIAPAALLWLPLKNAYFYLSAALYIAGWLIPHAVTAEWGMLYSFLTEFNAYFAAGVMLYRFYPQLSERIRFKNRRNFLAILVPFILLLLVLNYYFGDTNRVSGFLAATGSVLVIGGFLQFGITNRFFRMLGNMSYTLYITHYATVFLILALFVRLGIADGPASKDWYLWILAIPLVLLVTFPLYWLIERPCKHYLQQLRNR